MKTHILFLSKCFPKMIPDSYSGSAISTCFKSNFLNGKKIHQIKPDFLLWKIKIDEVKAGKAILSIREWEGDPFRSKQSEIARFTQHDSLGIQHISFDLANKIFLVDGKEMDPELIMTNECSYLDVFSFWFERQNPQMDMALIQFSDFKY